MAPLCENPAAMHINELFCINQFYFYEWRLYNPRLILPEIPSIRATRVLITRVFSLEPEGFILVIPSILSKSNQM